MANMFKSIFRRGISYSFPLRKEIENAAAGSEGYSGGLKFWRNMSLYVGLPVVGLCMLNTYLSTRHHEERPKFVKYDYLKMHTKKYPWGDGYHTLFHNPRTNATAEGYEDEL